MEQNNSTKPGKRPRIGARKESQETAPRKSYQPDWTVWDIVNPHLIAINRREMAEELATGYKKSSDRIKDISSKARGLDIVEAFGLVYDVSMVKPSTRESANSIPSSFVVGSTIELTISDISKKNGVIFESGPYKTSFITRNNLSTMTELPEGPVPARVVEIRPDYTIVDLIEPMAERFIMCRSKTPWMQNVLSNPDPVIVKDLKLVKGGFMGKAVIPNVSEFLGRSYEIDAFIPGSQIVLNTTDDFSQFEGSSVPAFIMSYGPKPNGQGLSLICSRKNFIKCLGYKNLKDIHNLWCDDGQEWDNFSHTPRTGIVTGIINSAKKCGVFVEIPELCLTGLVPTKPEELTSYAAGQEVTVYFKDLEEELKYNEAVDQKQHVQAFEMVDGAVKKCNIKPVLSFEI